MRAAQPLPTNSSRSTGNSRRAFMNSTFPKEWRMLPRLQRTVRVECPPGDREDNGRQDRADACRLARPYPAAPPVCGRFQNPTWCPKPVLRLQVLADQLGHVEHVHRGLAAEHRLEGRISVDHP